MTKVLYVIALSGLCLRAEPSTEAPVISITPYATKVMGTVEDGWLQTEDGYLSADWLDSDDPLNEHTYLGTWLTTAYTHSGNACFNGEYPEPDYTIATNSLPIGTEVYIENLGYRVVQDRGPSSMPDAWLDVFVDTYSEAVSYGEQHHGVWVIGGASQ